MDITHVKSQSNKSEIEDDNNTDDKVCVFETVINGGYIKQEEPCDIKDEQGGIYNFVNIKEEDVDNLTVVVEDPGFMINTKHNYPKRCEECGEEYDLYCLKCPMLIRIFNSNNPGRLHNSVRRTLPKKFLDIRETLSGVCIVALRAIPKGVVFGPFEGLDSTKDGAVSKWKLENKFLVYAKDPKRLNWMQYIRRAYQSSHQNLTPFQYEDGLYYRSDYHISAGDELLVRWDSGSEESDIQDLEDGYWKPRFCERLDDTYACTLCCVGYKSICHLAAHNSSCLEKGNEKDFCKEIIQCAFCKIYLDQKEYSDYHMDRCCKSKSKQYSLAAPRPPKVAEKPKTKDKYKCSMCEYTTSHESLFRHHQLTHTDVRMYKCPECPYRAGTKATLQKHVLAHANRNRFECEYCGERFARSDMFAIHQKKKHTVSVYKCDKCVFETMNARDFTRHIATHKGVKPYRCVTCGKQFKLERTLLLHVRNLHSGKEKEYKCPKCNYETTNSRNFKSHMLNMHGGVQRFKCPRCAFKARYKITLERHLRYHEDAEQYKCENCDMQFWNTGSLIRHKKEVHTITETVDKTYSCCKCEYRARSNYILNQHHLKVHDHPNFFACTLCPYKTTTNWSLNRHIAVTHNDDKPFKCDVCPQMFKHKASLTRHARNIHPKADKMEYE